MKEAKAVKPCFPDYKDSILNLSCSILNHYGIKPKHETLPQADSILARKADHVVVILLDGLGMNILEENLHYRDFLRRNLLMEYSSVFPPTTTASTTSFLSGLSPLEHGWLGWDVYFEQEDKTVCCFKNTIQGTGEKAADYLVAQKYLPYKDIITQINESGNAKAEGIYAFTKGPDYDVSDFVRDIRKSIHQEGKTFTYAYWDNPDTLLHERGTKSLEISKVVRELNAALVDLCENSKDTIFFITADHGHKDITNEYLTVNYSKIADMLVRRPSIEPRAMSFFVKEEFMEDFPREFNKYFSQDYILFSKKEFMEKNLLGPEEPNENLTGIGDFIAVAVNEKTLLWDRNDPVFRSHHAGLSKNEMKIPLIWYKKRKTNTFYVVYYTIVAMIVGFIFFILFH